MRLWPYVLFVAVYGSIVIPVIWGWSAGAVAAGAVIGSLGAMWHVA